MMPEEALMISTRFTLDKSPELPVSDTVTFGHRHDPDEPDRFRMITIDREVWEDMGTPDTITITIEPGDTINV